MESITLRKQSTNTPKTPRHSGSKTPRSNRKTPSKLTRGTSQDRFIPQRSIDELPDNFAIRNLRNASQSSESTASQEEYKQTLKQTMFEGKSEGTRILSFKAKAPPTGTKCNQSQHRVLYSQNPSLPAGLAKESKSVRRHISQTPYKILDAPDIIDDYYLNLLDWSSNNVLAVALSQTIYLWNASTGSIEQLHEFGGEDYVSSLKWMDKFLAVGSSNGKTLLFDCQENKLLRKMGGHDDRVSCSAWNPTNQWLLSTGGKDRKIVNHDVRVREHGFSTLREHSQEVCGLEWSCNGQQLASGGNDNLVNVWDIQQYNQPKHQFNRHIAAVKALSWCPHQADLLATGGGTADRHIRFWNTTSGALLREHDTKSQVCSIKWSKNFKDELVTSHGYSQNQLIVWKYPKMVKLAELTGHSSRVLHMACSPDGETVCSAAGDETLRFWKIFEKPHVSATTRAESSLREKKRQNNRSINNMNLR